MNLLNKLIIKDIKVNKKGTRNVIVGIMVAVAIITVVALFYSICIDSIISYLKKQEGNFHVSYFNIETETHIEELKNNRKVDKVFLTKKIGYAKIDSSNAFKPYACVKAFTKDALENLAINLQEGTMPKSEDEILVPNHLEKNGGKKYNVDDLVEIEIGKRQRNDKYLDQFSRYEAENKKYVEDLVDTSKKTYKVVGIIDRPSYYVEPYSAPGYTFITYLEEKNAASGVDAYVKYKDDNIKKWCKTTADILGIGTDEISKAVNEEQERNIDEQEVGNSSKDREKYDRLDVNYLLVKFQTHPMSVKKFRGRNLQVFTISVVFLIIGSIIIFILYMKKSYYYFFTDKIEQYGIIRGLGATKMQVKNGVFCENQWLGIIGTVIGLIIGHIVTFILVMILNLLIKSHVKIFRFEYTISLKTILIVVLISTITTTGLSYRIWLKITNTSLISSLKNSADIKNKLFKRTKKNNDIKSSNK